MPDEQADKIVKKVAETIYIDFLDLDGRITITDTGHILFNDGSGKFFKKVKFIETKSDRTS